MNHIQIAELLDRYWEGETTLVEERRLKDYFTSGAVDERFRDVAPLFQVLNDAHKVSAPEHLGTTISPAPMRVVGFNAWKQYMAAAVLTGVIAIGGWMYYHQSPADAAPLAANIPAPVQEVVSSNTPAVPAPQLAMKAPVKTKTVPRKKHIQPEESTITEAEALQAADEIKAALALVSRKLNKGKNDATKNLNKVEMVDHYFKQG